MITFDDIALPDVLEAQEFLVAALRTAYPAMDLRSGTVFREQLLRPQAEIYAAERARYRELMTTRSLQAMAEDGSEFTSEQVNAAASPFGVVRREGSPGTGVLRVTVTEATTYVLGPDDVFSGLRDEVVQFHPTATFVISTDPEPGQLRLYQINDGAWFFLLPVMAAVDGPAGRLDAGEEVSTALSGAVQAAAASEFTGGEAAETTRELIQRLPEAVARRTLDSRTSIAGLLRDTFPAVRATSVQGYGDPAQFRDRDNVLGIAASGMVDVYVKDFAAPVFTTLLLPGLQTSAGQYVIQVPPAAVPGFMRVMSVSTLTDQVTGPGSYVFDVVRSVVPGGSEPRPYLPADPWLSAMTVYQAARIVLRDAGDLGATPTFSVQFLVSPGLPDYHALLTDPAHRNVSADYLARAPHACLVHMRCPVRVAAGQRELTARTLQDAVLQLIHRKEFGGRITLSEVMSVLHTFPIDRVDTGASGFTMHGELLARGDRRVLTPPNQIDIDSLGLRADGIIAATTVFVATRDTIIVELRDA